MSTKDAIAAMIKGDSSKFRDEINNELMNRAMDRIEVRKIEVGQTMFDDDSEIEDYDIEDIEDEDV